MSKQVVNQLIDSSLSLLTAIKTILQDTPQVHSVEAARAAVIAIKAQITPVAPQLPSGASSAAAAVTEFEGKEEIEIERPKRKYGKRTTKKEKTASIKNLKKVTLRALINLGGKRTNNEIHDYITARPSKYILDGRIPASGLGPTLRLLHAEGLVNKFGERNTMTYEAVNAK